MRDRVRPGSLDLVRRPSHADGIDARRGGERPDHDRHVVCAAAGVGDVGEQEGAALVFGEAALELPAHQRMQLGVLVDRPLDAHDEALRLEQREVLLEVSRWRRYGRCAGLVAYVEHRCSSRLMLQPTYDLCCRGGNCRWTGSQACMVRVPHDQLWTINIETN